MQEGAFMKKEKKIEVKREEDILLLKEEERKKWEIALELRLFDKITANGWKSLTAKESGRIGGILSGREKQKKKTESILAENEKLGYDK